jgi:hypothetical protein
MLTQAFSCNYYVLQLCVLVNVGKIITEPSFQLSFIGTSLPGLLGCASFCLAKPGPKDQASKKKVTKIRPPHLLLKASAH